MPQMWYAMLYEPAVLWRMWRTCGYIVSILRYVSVFTIWVLLKLRCAIGRGWETTHKREQANIRLGKIWDSDVCDWSACHNSMSYSHYA
jgi:hypothetical protein